MTLSKYNTRRMAKISAIVSITLLLGACSDSKKTQVVPAPTAPQSYSLSVTNLTANQPMSPIALLFHTDKVMPWAAGQPASVALEKLAEGGDATDFDSLAGVNNRLSGSAPLAPGKTEDFSFEVQPADIKMLSVASMLVNTNDAFTGVQKIDLANFHLGESKKYRTMAYDAGTEANSEERGTMPGPVDGGEGFNSARNDVNWVHVHPGVISSDDGLANSLLKYSHRFDNPVAIITVTRTR